MASNYFEISTPISSFLARWKRLSRECAHENHRNNSKVWEIKNQIGTSTIHIPSELYKVKEVQLKFNSRWLTARATKVQFICQKLNFNFSQLMDELFWVATQMKFRENEVPPAEREEELSFFLVMTTKYCSSFSFYRGTLLSLWLHCNSKKLIHELDRS